MVHTSDPYFKCPTSFYGEGPYVYGEGPYVYGEGPYMLAAKYSFTP
jgi:hypothetical protein